MIIKQKELRPGEHLSLIEYCVTPQDAKELGTTPGIERQLSLNGRYKPFDGNTDPMASKYLTEQEFNELYDTTIASAQFDNVRNVLNKIKSEEDAQEVRRLTEGKMHLIRFYAIASQYLNK